MKIIEDCSPYYIRFTHDKINESIIFAKNLFIYDYRVETTGFDTVTMTPSQAKEFFELSPIYKRLPPMNCNRVSYFISQPKYYMRPHTDGFNHKWGINYPIAVLDEKCTTNWYENVNHYEIDIGYSRFLKGFKKENHTPVKSGVLRADECMLLNIGLFHDWDNSQSDNYRIVLTTRLQDHLYDRYDFDDAKKMLFGS